MSARVDATASRVQSAVTTKKVTKSMEVRISISVTVMFIVSPLPSPSGCREGHERRHEEHEPGEDQRVDGSVREGVRGPGRADERDGGSDEPEHGHQHPPGQRGEPDETGRGRGRLGAEHGPARARPADRGPEHSGLSGAGRAVPETRQAEANIERGLCDQNCDYHRVYENFNIDNIQIY